MKTPIHLTVIAIALTASSLFAQTPAPSASPSPTATVAATPAATAAATPTPTPAVGTVFANQSYSAAERIADAKAVIASSTDPDLIASATSFRDGLTLSSTTAKTYTPAIAALAASITAVKGFELPATTPDEANRAMMPALNVTIQNAYKTNAERLAYLKPFFLALGPTDGPSYTANLSSMYANTEVAAAQEALKARNYDLASQLISDPFLMTPPGAPTATVFTTSAIKSATRASDALAWAKAAYLIEGFAGSQNGINFVTAALRATDMSLVRSNPFIAAQNDATQPNILAPMPVPPSLSAGTLPEPAYAIANASLRGDSVGALKIAMAAYVTAGTNDALNTAVSGVAQALRNADGNLVRANAFVSAQKAGQSYPIAELAAQ